MWRICVTFASHVRHNCQTPAVFLRKECDAFASHLRHICVRTAQQLTFLWEIWAFFNEKNMWCILRHTCVTCGSRLRGALPLSFFGGRLRRHHVRLRRCLRHPFDLTPCRPMWAYYSELNKMSLLLWACYSELITKSLPQWAYYIELTTMSLLQWAYCTDLITMSLLHWAYYNKLIPVSLKQWAYYS